jgi:glycosyltransferase involved in cell wall biosynthesis
MKSGTQHKNIPNAGGGRRLKVAFFDYPDVFEDFYPHYHIDQKTFATRWHNTGSHAWLKIVQEEIGDVTWYMLTLKPQLKEAIHEYVGCRVKFLPSSWFHRKFWHLFYLSPNSWKWRRFYRSYANIASYIALLSWSLVKELRKDKPDVFFVQEYCSGRFDILLLYAKILKIPLVTYHAGSTSDKYIGKFLKYFTIPRADHIFPSGMQELQRLRNTHKICPDRLSIIRPPIDLAVYKLIPRESACSAVGLDVSRRYFLFLGRFDDHVKRISAIIKVFERVSREYPDIDLLITGAGEDEKKLKQQALELIPGRVHFMGWISGDGEKAQLLNTAECLVMASKREGFPTIIGEAFACGISVVSSNVGTISDLVIEGKTGWLFPSEDDEAMLKCLLWVAAHPQEIKSMKPVIRSHAEEHVSFKAIAEILKSAFSSLKYANTPT